MDGKRQDTWDKEPWLGEIAYWQIKNLTITNALKICAAQISVSVNTLTKEKLSTFCSRVICKDALKSGFDSFWKTNPRDGNPAPRYTDFQCAKQTLVDNQRLNCSDENLPRFLSCCKKGEMHQMELRVTFAILKVYCSGNSHLCSDQGTRNSIFRDTRIWCFMSEEAIVLKRILPASLTLPSLHCRETTIRHVQRLLVSWCIWRARCGFIVLEVQLSSADYTLWWMGPSLLSFIAG